MKRYLNALLDIINPPTCTICERRIKSSFICNKCSPSINNFNISSRCIVCFSSITSNSSSICATCRVFPLPISRVRYLWSYNEDKVNDFINVMKYRPAKELCSWASQQLSKSFDLLFPTHDWELIIPLPSSRASLQERLFNQCKEIAYYLKKNIVLPAKLAPLALRHHGDSKPQASLTHKERLKNVANCFKASPKMVYGRSILLVDDVITTGATSTAATIELLKKGASKVDLIALARSDNWQEHRQSVNKFFLSLGIDNEFPRSSAS